MNKYELLEKFISQIQAGKKPQIKTKSKEVLEVLSMAQSLVIAKKEISPEFKENLKDQLINTNKVKFTEQQNQMPPDKTDKGEKPMFPRWGYVTAFAAIVVLIGGLTIIQNQKSNILSPNFTKDSGSQLGLEDSQTSKLAAESNEQKSQPTKLVSVDNLVDVDTELFADISNFDADFVELSNLGDELATLDSDLAQLTF